MKAVARVRREIDAFLRITRSARAKRRGEVVQVVECFPRCLPDPRTRRRVTPASPLPR